MHFYMSRQHHNSTTHKQTPYVNALLDFEDVVADILFARALERHFGTDQTAENANPIILLADLICCPTKRNHKISSGNTVSPRT